MGIENTRRSVLAGIPAMGALVLFGCGAAEDRAGAGEASTESSSRATIEATAMTVYRDPNCGCCKSWAEIARRAGYEPTIVDRQDMPAIKVKLGVPADLASCHTTLIAGYVVEGHVPMADVKRLISARPRGVRGIAVPGMPIGSPGMEAPDGTTDAFAVMAFDGTGHSMPFTV